MTKLPVAMTLALGGPAAPAFAGETIAISYHQVGICKGYDTAAGTGTTRSGEAFALFKIEAVDNTKSRARLCHIVFALTPHMAAPYWNFCAT